jgi:hypothetical protein
MVVVYWCSSSRSDSAIVLLKGPHLLLHSCSRRIDLLLGSVCSRLRLLRSIACHILHNLHHSKEALLSVARL